MKKLLQLPLIMLLIVAGKAFAQTPFITLAGTVTNARTGEAVAFASVQLKEAGTGTASNASGKFVFKIAGRHSADTVLISCIGYETAKLPVPGGNMLDMDLRLEPAVIMLPEVSVSAPNGLAILKEAIARIPENYDTSDVRLTAFYREDLRLAGDTLAFNESVLDIYKTFQVDKDWQDQIRIIKGRRKEVDHSADPRLYSWISNISNTAYSSLREDVVKYIHAKNNFLNERNFRYYNFEYRETIPEGDRNLLLLEVTPRKKSRKGFVNAKLFIDEVSKAFVKIEISVNPRGVEYMNKHGKGGIRYTIMSKFMKARIDFTGLNVTLSYKNHKEKWYLGSVQRHWDIVLNSPSRNIHDMPWTGDFYLLVTGVDKDSVQRFTTGAYDRVSSINSLIGSDYDAAFWENYNILRPDLPDSLNHVMPASTHDTSIIPPAGMRDTVEGPDPTAWGDTTALHDGTTVHDTIAGPYNPPVRVSNRANGFTRQTRCGECSPLFVPAMMSPFTILMWTSTWKAVP